jgi:hypothetical protein
VLVGLNDTGKTALLDAIALYGRLDECLGRLEDWHPWRRPAGSLVRAHFTATWRSSESRAIYHHGFMGDAADPVETLRCEAAGLQLEWHPGGAALLIDGEALSLGDQAGGRSLRSLRRELESGRGSAKLRAEQRRLLDAVPDLETPRRRLLHPTDLGRSVHLDAVGERPRGDWRLLLHSLCVSRDEDLPRIDEAMRRLFPFFRRGRARARWDETPPPDPEHDDPVYIESYEPEFEVREGAGNALWVPASTVSSGVLLCYAYLIMALGEHPGSFLALEEPENGLNPHIMLDMMGAFLDIIKERGHQLIMTTHNEFWLDFVGPRRIRVLTRDDEGTHVHDVRDNLQSVLDEGLYISEIMGLGGPDELLRPRELAGDAEEAECEAEEVEA